MNYLLSVGFRSIGHQTPITGALGGSWFVGAFEALTLKPPALPEDTYFCQTRRYIASKNNIIASKDIFIITGANS